MQVQPLITPKFGLVSGEKTGTVGTIFKADGSIQFCRGVDTNLIVRASKDAAINLDVLSLLLDVKIERVEALLMRVFRINPERKLRKALVSHLLHVEANALDVCLVRLAL